MADTAKKPNKFIAFFSRIGKFFREIKSEIKKGNFDAEIIDYIMDMSDEDFEDSVLSVIENDLSIVEDDIKDKLLKNDDFICTIIDKIFDFNDTTIDDKIKQYIRKNDIG